MELKTEVPNRVGLVYRKVADYHVFTCADIPGLHVGNSYLKNAFDSAISALSVHASATFDCTAVYVAEVSFEEFQAHLENPEDLSAPLVSLHLEDDRVAA